MPSTSFIVTIHPPSAARYRPSNETYAAEIERVLLNGIISQIPFQPYAPPSLGIRQFALLHKVGSCVIGWSVLCLCLGGRDWSECVVSVSVWL